MARTKDAVLAPEQKELMEKEYLDFVKPSTYGNKANPSSCNSLYDDVENPELRAIVEKVAATTSNMEDELTNEVQSPPNPQKRISGKQRKATLEEYQQTFLQVPRIDDRKPVFVSSDVRDRLDRVVRILGGRRMSVSGIIENIVRHHLSLYEEAMSRTRAKIRHGNLKTSVFNFCGSMLPGFADFNAKSKKKNLHDCNEYMNNDELRNTLKFSQLSLYANKQATTKLPRYSQSVAWLHSVHLLCTRQSVNGANRDHYTNK